jgi:vacuolar-type H+-ATPase subunit F/Vma7
MTRTYFIGDEVAAAGWRLAGVDTRVPEPGAEGEALAAAANDATLVLVSAETATRIPDNQLRAALRRVTPITVIVPDLRGVVPYPDVAARMKRQLGIET